MTPEQQAGLVRLVSRWPQLRLELESATEDWIVGAYGDFERATRAYLHWSQRLGGQPQSLAEGCHGIVVELEKEIIEAVAGASAMHGGNGARIVHAPTDGGDPQRSDRSSAD